MLTGCWFPGRPGSKRNTEGRKVSSVAAPATVSGELASDFWPLGNREGRTQAVTREPGDLPAQSPNRWAGGPHGAAVRSGDMNRREGRVRTFSRAFKGYRLLLRLEPEASERYAGEQMALRVRCHLGTGGGCRAKGCVLWGLFYSDWAEKSAAFIWRSERS